MPCLLLFRFWVWTHLLLQLQSQDFFAATLGNLLRTVLVARVVPHSFPPDSIRLTP